MTRAASLREQVAAACRALAQAGLVRATSGNVSARDGERVAITPTGGVLAELEPEAVAVVDLDGALVEGPLAPTSEIALHLGAYRRYGAGAVVHTHAPVATALSLVLDELPCVHYEMLALGGAVRVAPYRTFGTAELAEAVLDALDGRADGQPRGDHDRRRPRHGRRACPSARVGVHALLACRRDRRAARARPRGA